MAGGRRSSSPCISADWRLGAEEALYRYMNYITTLPSPRLIGMPMRYLPSGGRWYDLDAVPRPGDGRMIPVRGSLQNKRIRRVMDAFVRSVIFVCTCKCPSPRHCLFPKASPPPPVMLLEQPASVVCRGMKAAVGHSPNPQSSSPSPIGFPNTLGDHAASRPSPSRHLTPLKPAHPDPSSAHRPTDR